MMVSFQSPKDKRKGRMGEEEEGRGNKSGAGKKRSFLAPPPQPLPPRTVANSPPYNQQHITCCPPPLSPNNNNTTVHHFGVAQLLSAASSLCQRRFLRTPFSQQRSLPPASLHSHKNLLHHHQHLPQQVPDYHANNNNDSNKLSLNYIVNGNQVPVTFRQLPGGSGVVRLEEYPKKSLPEISISAINNKSTWNNGYLGGSNGLGKAESEGESKILSRGTLRSNHFPCGPEVLQNNIQAKKKIESEVAASQSLTPPAAPPQPSDDKLDLSKLNYLSHLACEVEKLDTTKGSSTATRKERAQEVLNNGPEEEVATGGHLRPTDSPVIVLTAINGKPVESMGVFNTGNMKTSGGGGCESTVIRVKQEAVDPSPEGSGDEVLDLRKPLSEKVCIWCHKNPALVEDGAESDFCSEQCFHMFRRDSFKKRSNCIWCSGASPAKNNPAPLGVIDESRFCSEECLTNYKVKLFCEETSALSAHLDQLKGKGLQMNGSSSSNGCGGKIDPQGRNGSPIASTTSASANRALAHSQGNELITPELWLKKLSKKNNNGKESEKESSHNNNTHSSASTSPVSESGTSAISPPLHTGEVQQLALKQRLYPNFHGGRRRAASPLLERVGACNLPQRTSSVRSAPECYSVAPRKRMKTALTTSTIHGGNSGGNFLHNTFLSFDHAQHQFQQQQGAQQGVGMPPMSMSMLQMGAALAAMNGLNPVPAHPKRKSHSSSDPNAEIARALMRGSRHHHRPHPSSTGPHPPIMMQHHQGGRGNGASQMTHSGLHAGGLMMASPTNSGAINCSNNNNNSNKKSCISFSPPNPPHPIPENELVLNPFTSQTSSNMPQIEPPNPRRITLEQRQASTSPIIFTTDSGTQTDAEEKKEEKSGVFGEHFLSSMLPPVTLLVPYIVPIPVPVPMPIFFPSQLNPYLGSKQDIPAQKEAKEEQGNPNPPTPHTSPPSNDTPLMEEEKEVVDEIEKEIQAAIEISLQECSIGKNLKIKEEVVENAEEEDNVMEEGELVIEEGNEEGEANEISQNEEPTEQG